MTVGSNLWANQTPTKKHLLNGPGGIAKEVQDVRLDLAAVLQPLVGVAIEEYINPPGVVAAAIMPITASRVGTVSYQYAQLVGSVGEGVISPPRNVVVVTAGATATQAPTSVVITGFDVQGRALTETITGTAAGANTYAGVKCFAKVTGVQFVGGTGVAATVSIGTGVVIGLSYAPKTRAGMAVTAGSGAMIRKEVYDGAVVTSGALTAAATNLPFGAYTPGTAPTTLAPASTSGSVDISQATGSAMYGSGGTLDGLTLTITATGSTPTSLVLNGLTNAATEAAFLAAIQANWPTLLATQDGSKHLVLTQTLSGYLNVITVTAGAGSGALALGIAATTTHGGGHQYCLEYEVDGTQLPDGSLTQ